MQLDAEGAPPHMLYVTEFVPEATLMPFNQICIVSPLSDGFEFAVIVPVAPYCRELEVPNASVGIPATVYVSVFEMLDGVLAESLK